MKLPDAARAARLQTRGAALDATLRHVSGWPVLSITGSPQTMELQLVNRSAHPLRAGPARLQLQFRAGILMALDALVLAPQSQPAWTLAIERTSAQSEVTLVLAGVDAFTLAPGEAMAVRLKGVSADPSGGSRATRVELHYRGFFQPSGRELAGSRLMHLPVLRRHEPPDLPASELRGASHAVCGPFTAGFVGRDTSGKVSGSAAVLNDGKSANTLLLRVVNTSSRAIELAHADDEATRFYLSFRTGAEPAGWGLIEAQTDHVSLELAGAASQSPAWQVDHHTLRRMTPGRWRPLETLELQITVHSSAPAGTAQLILSYENLPHEDDGDLVLLVSLGPTAARPDALVTVAPIELRGAQARLSFHPEEVLGAPPSHLPASAIEVSHTEGSVGRLDVQAPAGVRVEGDLKVTGMFQPPATFVLGGSADTFYPVVFEDLAWDCGELRLELFRALTRTDGPWHGSMMAKIACHGERFGNGSAYWSLEIHQWSASTTAHKHFVGGFQNDLYRPMHVIWLAGATSYAWRAEHPARMVDADLAQPGPVVLSGDGPTVRYEIRTTLPAGFDADHLSMRRLSGRIAGPDEDVAAVPSGAIVLWPRSDSAPFGWGVCDGVQASPDLSAAFPPLLKYIRKLG